MCLKIRCDGESEKICKIFWKLNKAVTSHWQLTLTVTAIATGQQRGCVQRYIVALFSSKNFAKFFRFPVTSNL